jgi:DNA-binding YbaB/EbfC family protein
MFDMFKNLGNLGDLMRRANEMREQVRAMQEELGRRQVTAEAGAGMVQATVNGKLELVKLRIDRERIDPADTEMLEDLIVAAVHAAQTRAAEMLREEMQKKAAEMGLPPGLMG